MKTKYVEYLNGTARQLAKKDGERRVIRGCHFGMEWTYFLCVKGSEFEQEILKKRQS